MAMGCCQHSVRERKTLITVRAGLQDRWDCFCRQELPPVPRLPSIHLLPLPQPYIPLSASMGVQSPHLCRDPGEERRALMLLPDACPGDGC